MKLSEYIPQEVNLIKNRSGIDVANESERRLKELLASDGDAELDDEFVALSLGWMNSLSDYNQVTQKVYWALWDAAKEIILKPTYK